MDQFFDKKLLHTLLPEKLLYNLLWKASVYLLAYCNVEYGLPE